ncbi:ABC transporter permease [Croceivirga sp. JEA036]|uniref:ABC transporter permease n=1 Tax=Croceivirga sp. JEA036 TaxID=2721162 RepID=UPI00143B96C4|nr:ABC transporter permease [Croceivirga sp. JEA036]NJB37415.1 ABC transporter permease [Croceivirga sp. JEA036]
MNTWKIVLRNLKNKPLYTFLSVFSLSISIALLLGVLQLDASVQNQFKNSLGDVDLVVGAKGSPLQLVLSSVLHVDNPTGNISYPEAIKLTRNPLIKNAAPISYGDNYKGYRIVGTTPAFDSFYAAEIATGTSPKTSMEAVIGSEVAQKLGLQLGDTFKSAHGLTDGAIEEHDAEFKVVGIYKKSYKVLDRLIITTLESIWDVHDHEEHEVHEEHEEHEHEEAHQHEAKEVTSLLLSFRSPVGLLTTPRMINEQTNMQAALPRFELDRLFKFTGIGIQAISWIAYIILIISCITIFISLYKMVKERAFDLALMRTYGASNLKISTIIALEGICIVVLSLLIGFALSQLGLHFVFTILKSSLQQDIMSTLPLQSFLYTVILILAVILIGITMAIVPLFKMNISKILSDEK